MGSVISKLRGWIGWVFFLDLMNGLALTLGYMFTRTITLQYPDKQKWVPYPRHRGHHFLKTNDEGDLNCVACELCAKICPCDCIKVVPFEDEKGNRRPTVFDIDLSRCLFCGLCEDACPADAIALGQEYELASYDTKDLLVGRDLLRTIAGKAENGGKVIGAELTGEAGVVVRETKGEQDWWQRVWGRRSKPKVRHRKPQARPRYLQPGSATITHDRRQ